MPMVITSCVKVYRAKNMSVPYAGYFVKKVENGKYSLSVAKKYQKAKIFMNMLKNMGLQQQLNFIEYRSKRLKIIDLIQKITDKRNESDIGTRRIEGGGGIMKSIILFLCGSSRDTVNS